MTKENKTTETSENSTSSRKRCNHKTSHKIMIVAGLAAIVSIAAYTGAAHSSGWGDDDHGYGGNKHSHMMSMFNEFDLDKDGRLTRAEIDTARATRFSRADANSDAALSLDEFQDLWVDFMRSKMVDKFQMLDEDGDARVTEQEFAKPFNMALRYMDRDDDGVLEMKEMKHKRHWYHDDDDDDDRNKD